MATVQGNGQYFEFGGNRVLFKDAAGREMIAHEETSSTASKAYAIGEAFIYNNRLYRATAAIAQGGTITPGTNCQAVPGGLGGEVSDLKSALNTLEEIIIQPYDLSQETTINYSISASTGKWVSGSNYVCYYFAVPTGAKYLILDSNETNGTVYALLTAADGHVVGNTPSYATGSGRMFASAGTQVTVSIPSDCKYIWVSKTLGANSYEPESVYFAQDLSLLDSIKPLQEDQEKADAIIEQISGSNKNLWTGDATISFTTNKTVTVNPAIPAGTYCLSAICTSSDTDTSKCRFQINGGSITKDLGRGERSGNYFTVDSPITSITFYAAAGGSASTGDTATWADIQIEIGVYATAYVPHKTVAVDEIARTKVDKIVKYVSPSGADTNDGNTDTTPYATIGKALSVNADVIYVKHGTYTEGISENTAYRYGSVRIICDNATLIPPVNGLHFRFCNVQISGLTVDVSDASSSSSYGFFLLNCTGALSDCVVIGSNGAGGFRLDGSRITLTRCTASGCGVDGFNRHTITEGYETECTLIDCIAHDCGDDGASIHESGIMYVIGGEYYNNVQTGLAPHDKCAFEALNVHCHHNGIGIEAVNDTLESGETPAVGRIIGCILAHNTTYGLDVKNYTVNALGNAYSDNGTGKTRAGSGATINAFVAD